MQFADDCGASYYSASARAVSRLSMSALNKRVPILPRVGYQQPSDVAVTVFGRPRLTVESAVLCGGRLDGCRVDVECAFRSR